MPFWITPQERHRERCHQVLNAIGATDAPCPLYIIYGSELPPHLRGDKVRGLTGISTDAALRSVIGARWKGRGAAILLNDTLFDEYMARGTADGFPAPIVEGAFWNSLLDTAIHEAAHVLEPDSVRALALQAAIEQTPDDDLAAREAVDIANGMRGENKTPAQIHVPMYAHGPWFFRLAAHLAYRAKTMEGLAIAPDDVVCHQLYQAHPLADYLAALGREPQAFAHRRLTDLHREPFPTAFRDLWQADVRAWFLDATAEMGTWDQDKRDAFAAGLKAANRDLFMEDPAPEASEPDTPELSPGAA